MQVGPCQIDLRTLRFRLDPAADENPHLVLLTGSSADPGCRLILVRVASRWLLGTRPRVGGRVGGIVRAAARDRRGCDNNQNQGQTWRLHHYPPTSDQRV